MVRVGSNGLGFGLDHFHLSFVPIGIYLFVIGASRDRFIGVLDGMASLVPLGVTLVVIFGKPEYLDTLEKWEAAFLFLCVTATDLFGGCNQHCAEPTNDACRKSSFHLISAILRECLGEPPTPTAAPDNRFAYRVAPSVA